jgi:hypothetical protein
MESELRVEKACPGRPADRVMGQREKIKIAASETKPADAHGHSARPDRGAGPDVEGGLGTVILLPKDERSDRGRRQAEFLRKAPV